MTTEPTTEPTTELTELAADAYIYGYPLVHELTMVESFTRTGMGNLTATPFNQFGHVHQPADPAAKFVSLNNDTLYSIAQLDLSGGPLLLHVPDYRGAYFVLQFVDAWTNNFAYVGHRATGTEQSTWLIAPPGWAGTAPEDVRIIDAPTSVVTVVGRSACTGPRDMPRVTALQRALTIASPQPRGPASAVRSGLPQPDPAVPEPLRFFELLRIWMADFPPAAPDLAYQDRFQPLGLLEEGPSPYVGADPVLVRALEAGLADGRARVEAASGPPPPAQLPAGGWDMDLHLFDYNVDHLGPGTLDEARWQITDRHTARLTRAVAARTALWGSHAYEAVYAHTFTDADGKQLTGAKSYTLRFDARPPADAFWSVTMYDSPDHYLVANPLGRYSVGDRIPGLRYAADGSLTLVLQRDRPTDPDEAANWLPTPAGDFRPMVRLYTPREEVLDGTYRLPPIEVHHG
ncbi:DUF1254 domain-containing protein [Streptomyces sp. A3M-1-3]|uniref:DUF1254 domain-containing protein n=1 Tax=Streptomyces sp. A3M-1-3 TaxID=2962044 RepID=UPI0027E3CA36|nr:DUF1254 domain-containing protein [Streptomyces sp. A3M-1-3]